MRVACSEEHRFHSTTVASLRNPSPRPAQWRTFGPAGRLPVRIRKRITGVYSDVCLLLIEIQWSAVSGLVLADIGDIGQPPGRCFVQMLQ